MEAAVDAVFSFFGRVKKKGEEPKPYDGVLSDDMSFDGTKPDRALSRQDHIEHHKYSLSAEAKESALQEWNAYRRKLPKTNKAELRKYRDAHIAELLFHEDKTFEQIATVVFHNEQDLTVETKKKRVFDAKKRIIKIARDDRLPIPHRAQS